MTKYQSTIQLKILGPFLTAATSSEIYNLDKAFYRNASNEPVIPSSHIKGKLRMALEELAHVDVDGFYLDVDTWFGTESEEGSYEPLPGLLNFSDFRLVGEVNSQTRTRTAIDTKSGTAAEKQLRQVEDLFLAGKSTTWEGKVVFYIEGQEEARQINNALKIGFRWLTNLGAEKGVGFGRLFKVRFEKLKPAESNNIDASNLGESLDLHLRIRPIEFIMIGGIKKPRANFVRSKRIIPGGAIKGALAFCLNQAHSIKPFHHPLSKDIGIQMPGFELLAEYFDQIRVTHAFPARKEQPRPIKIPISVVEAGGKEYDMALTTNPSPIINGRSPAYFIDRKNSPVYIGDAVPKEIFVTRTEIDDKTRRSQERNLFTYSFFCGEDKDKKLIEWICNVNFDNITDIEIRQQVRDQFAQAVVLYLDRLGKLNNEVKVQMFSDAAPPAMESKGLITNDEVILTLQTDSIMLNPEEVRHLKLGDDLFQPYAEYWNEISTRNGSESCLELMDFFAHQNFQGGYLYHRYLGAGERKQKPKSYYPYYLTRAGSVFRLKVKDAKVARECVESWLKGGLDFPAWAHKKYGQYDRSLWQNCPFVPENGYGEIIVNLDLHWAKQANKHLM